jgi:hypothetical protein
MTPYCMAALAAGVGVLALANPAECEVVFTKKTIPIPLSTTSGHFVPISLTNNGVTDFEFSLYSSSYKGSGYRLLRVLPVEGGAVMGKELFVSHFSYASELAKGAKIGPSAHFSSKANMNIELSLFSFANTSVKYSKRFIGNWGNNPKSSYLGVRFLINGKTHYGWIRLKVTTQKKGAMTAEVTGYAYETVANKVIKAGTTSGPVSVQAQMQPERQDPVTLGMLALGAEGVAFWRRDDLISPN